MIKNTKPLHPGQVLDEVYIKEMDLNQSQLAAKCKCSPRKINGDQIFIFSWPNLRSPIDPHKFVGVQTYNRNAGHNYIPGQLRLQPIIGGKGVQLDFTATGKDGTVYHQESSQIAPDMNEKLFLWNFNSNTPGMVPHCLRKSEQQNSKKTYLFGFNSPDDTQSFREEIALEVWDDGDVSYTYSWGLPGGDFQERSGARMKPSGENPDLNHIHLAVSNLEQSQTFYTNFFGFKKRVFHGKCLFMSSSDGYDLALDPEVKPVEFPSWFHIGVRLKSGKEVKKLFSRISEQEPNSIKRSIEEYNDFVFFRCVDPDGYEIEVYWE